MIDKLTNCPQCGGTLNEAGRCRFCGSKIYDFLAIDFNERNMPSAKTYIRLKVNGKIVLAPVIVDSLSAEFHSNYDAYTIDTGETMYLSRPCYPRLTLDLAVIGDVISIERGDAE